MTFFTRAHRKSPACHPRVPSPHARLRHGFLLALACFFVLSTGCKRSPSTQESPPKTTTKATPAPTKAELDQLAREREAFGLPLPPDVTNVHRTKAYVRANSFMKLAELEAFYKTRLVDYEFLYSPVAENSNRPPHELHIVGLRSFMPHITIRHPGGKFGNATLDFRPAAPPQPIEITDNQPASAPPSTATPNPPSATAPNTKRREPGMPVLDRNANGELIAPGARWHEPYVPPEGSPLHTKRNRANFGRPYGQWKTP